MTIPRQGMGQMTPPHSPDSRYLVFIAPRGCRIFSRQFREFRGGGADAWLACGLRSTAAARGGGGAAKILLIVATYDPAHTAQFGRDASTVGHNLLH